MLAASGCWLAVVAIGLTERIGAALVDTRHASYITLQELAEPTRQRVCAPWTSVPTQDVVLEPVRLFDEFPYAARSKP